MQGLLSASISCASVCTATKSVMFIAEEDWIAQAADFLASLVVGDPLEPDTQVGYTDPSCLDYLEDLRQKNRLHSQVYGGERRSPIQADPLLVASQEAVPDFFGQEIPAYVLAVRRCESISAAVDQINAYAGEQPRLAVSFLNCPKDQLAGALFKVRAHTVLVDRPTTTLLPAFHEGNDYALLLAQPRFLVP
jgi:acyl-CoA reductase-like NAD-dependent aldehyde dehydrogenase